MRPACSDCQKQSAVAVKALRALLVAGPLVAFGCWLGLRGGSAPVMPPPFEDDASGAPVPVVVDSSGMASEDAFLKEISKAGSFELQGGKDCSTRMELTREKLEDALEKYRAQALKDGYKEDPVLDSSFAGLDPKTVFRAYRGNGKLRIVLVGAKRSAENPARPVTIFEGTFAAHVE
ncbi:MAG: hypothetical protein JXR97_07205 [Planctomycetes bacterium]|nr:hypothetical protein [Planctomycetota bacterium]